MIRKAGRALSKLNSFAWTLVCWSTLAMVLIGSFNAIARYGGGMIGLELSSNAYLEMQWYLFGVVFLLGAAPTLKRDGHVRVDVLYSQLSDRKKAWIDLLGSALFVVPFCTLMLWATWHTVWNSWVELEWSSNPNGLPRYLIKSIIPISFSLLLFQGIDTCVKKYRLLFWDSPPPDSGSGR